MFEEWIDRVLNNKLKIKALLHLGTEFEYTRTIDEHGNVINPFEEKFDITKATDLSSFAKKAEKINVDSPRFSKQLQKTLADLFAKMDKDGSGNLSVEELHLGLKSLAYGLTEDDVLALVSLADENEDGLIQFEEFTTIALDTIKAFLARNKANEMINQREKKIHQEAMAMVYWPEIENADKILQKKFSKLDKDKNGIIYVEQLKKILIDCNLVTPKERKMLLHKIKSNEFEYKNFSQLLYEVRFILSKSKIMDMNLDSLSQHIVDLCKFEDKEETGKVHVTLIKKLMMSSKKLSLTPMQIQIALGYAKLDEAGLVNYEEFAVRCRDMISQIFTYDNLSALASKFKAEDVKKELTHKEDAQLTNLELFSIFKKYDINQNGSLDIPEYLQCIQETGMNLTQEEILTLCLAADMNGDGVIDYEEFMKHFRDVVEMIKIQRIMMTAMNSIVNA